MTDTNTNKVENEERELTIKVKFKSPFGVTEADLYRELLMMETGYNSKASKFRLHITKIYDKKG